MKLPEGTCGTCDLCSCADVVPLGALQEKAHGNRFEPTECKHNHRTPGSEGQENTAEGTVHGAKGKCAGGKSRGPHGVLRSC